MKERDDFRGSSSNSLNAADRAELHPIVRVLRETRGGEGEMNGTQVGNEQFLSVLKSEMRQIGNRSNCPISESFASQRQSPPLRNARRYGTDVRRRAGTNPKAILGSGYASAVRCAPSRLPLIAFTLVSDAKRTDVRIDWRAYVRRGGGSKGKGRGPAAARAYVRACVRARAYVHVIRVAKSSHLPSASRWTVKDLKPPLPSRERSSRARGRLARRAYIRRRESLFIPKRRSFFFLSSPSEREYVACLGVRKLRLLVICENGGSA